MPDHNPPDGNPYDMPELTLMTAGAAMRRYRPSI